MNFLLRIAQTFALVVLFMNGNGEHDAVMLEALAVFVLCEIPLRMPDWKPSTKP